MIREQTITVEDVKRLVRRGHSGDVANRDGWSIFVTSEGNVLYVVGKEDGVTRPVPFKELQCLRDGSKHFPYSRANRFRV